MNEEGYVYVLYNPIYNTYGEIYKIGQTKDLNNRLNHYSTSYPEESEMKYSIIHKYYKEIEKIVHFNLKEYRMNNNREFFKCKLETIIECIDKVKNYTLDEISSIINKPMKDILRGYDNQILEGSIDLSKENIIKVYNDSLTYIKDNFRRNGVKIFVKIFIDKICTDTEGKLLIECVDKYKHKYKYIEANKRVIVSFNNMFDIINNSFNIKHCLFKIEDDIINNAEQKDNVDQKYISYIKEMFEYEIKNIKKTFKNELLKYFI